MDDDGLLYLSEEDAFCGTLGFMGFPLMRGAEGREESLWLAFGDAALAAMPRRPNKNKKGWVEYTNEE
jgi:hypothetical protein